MASGHACAPKRADRSSSVVGARAVSASAPEERRPQPLRGRKRFDRLYAAGHRVRRGGITLYGAPGDPGVVRVGVAAGKKVGGSVERNRAKRRLRAAARQVGFPPGNDFLIVASRAAVEAPFEDLVHWLTEAMEAS